MIEVQRKGYYVIQERKAHYVITTVEGTVFERTVTQAQLRAMMKEIKIRSVKIKK